MTEEEFKSDIAKLSPPIESALQSTNGAKIGAELGQLAIGFTGTSDLSAALDILKSDKTKMSSFEAIVASAVRVAGTNPVPAPPPPTVQAAAPAQMKSEVRLMWVGPSSLVCGVIGFFVMLFSLLHTEATALEKWGIFRTFYLPCSELWGRRSPKLSTIG